MSHLPYLARILHRGHFLGTGVLVAKDRVLTCRHVVAAGACLLKKVDVEIANGKALPGQVVARSSDEVDLALIELKSPVTAQVPDWVNAAPEGASVMLTGCTGLDAPVTQLCKILGSDLRNGRVERMGVHTGAQYGMSGGIARLIAQDGCIGITRHRLDNVSSDLAGGELGAAFLCSLPPPLSHEASRMALRGNGKHPTPRPYRVQLPSPLALSSA